MLASRFSGRWDDSIEKDEVGNFFIDQEYSMLRHVIRYLRDKANGDKKYPMKSPIINRETFSKEDFYRMLEYYGLTDGIYPVELRIHSSPVIEPLNSRKVDATEWMTLNLAQMGHDRIVKKYEVTLGTVQCIQIGWHRLDPNFVWENNAQGIGDPSDKPSFALDLFRSFFCVMENLVLLTAV